MSAKHKQRVFWLLLLLVLVLAYLSGKLFWIQVISAEHYSAYNVDLVKNSVAQRQQALVLSSGRGDIYDRSLQPFTGRTIQALAAFPVRDGYSGDSAQLAGLTRVLHTTTAQWQTFASGLNVAKLWGADGGEPTALSKEQAQQIEALGLPNARVVSYQIRYPADMAARQVIGFIGQNPERVQGLFASELAGGKLTLTSRIGAAGLEKTFEPWLRGQGATSISYFTDAGKRPLGGLDARIIQPDNPYYPLKLVTTLDADIQQRIEQLMDRMHIREGSAVVLDAQQADVIAMASRPNFNPAQIDPSGGAWGNEAVKATTPGSIFKTIVAAAALEEGVVEPDETFDCEGALGKYGFTCWKKGGHGPLTLEQGFAESCNIVFARVAQRLSAEQIETYARKLGLLAPVGWTGAIGEQAGLSMWDGEEAGQLFAAKTPRSDEGVLMQTAIGQRDVLVTPLQAANMIVTLLHGGEALEPRIVQELRYRTDRVMQRFPTQKLVAGAGAISEETSRTLLKWMQEVVEDGTGQSLKGAKWKLAGKSGTAQVGAEANQTVNQWFIGYGPVDAPRYAVSVVVAHTDPQAANQALPLFKGIMDILAGQ
ncbi:peptidoglycan D,D-transpeptidase FtsI family protein [Paenibacillus athensensis]|nr:penicillin-binding protein 2 [Paenibacillus athensensis]